MSKEKFYDLYLYTIPDCNNLIKIDHLLFNVAKDYSKNWVKLNNTHDFMLVTEGSTPWIEPAPNITIKTIKECDEYINQNFFSFLPEGG